MKPNAVFSLTLLSVIFCGCQNSGSSKASTTDTTISRVSKSTATAVDNRPKDELYFLNRIKAESDNDVTSNAIKKDIHITAFNKYAADSLNKIYDWEMIVTEINDNQLEASSLAKALFDLDNNPVYNLQLVSPIKIDKTVDTIAIDNRVDFTYTVPKNPKGDTLKKQLTLIKTLSKGDTVIVSGALTHIDNGGKVNFASFYDQYLPWNVDLLLKSIRKKSAK